MLSCVSPHMITQSYCKYKSRSAWLPFCHYDIRQEGNQKIESNTRLKLQKHKTLKPQFSKANVWIKSPVQVFAGWRTHSLANNLSRNLYPRRNSDQTGKEWKLLFLTEKYAFVLLFIFLLTHLLLIHLSQHLVVSWCRLYKLTGSE